MVSIRSATQQDAAAISRVHVESWRTTYAGIVPQAYLDGLNETERTSFWSDRLLRDKHVFVAETEGEIVAFISGGAIREPLQDFAAELFALYLLKHVQRRGIGTALLQALVQSLQDQGFMSMAVWVLESNNSSHFFESSGAVLLASSEIEIGGSILPLVAYGWPDIEVITSSAPVE